jgi:hypothetical protein
VFSGGPSHVFVVAYGRCRACGSQSATQESDRAWLIGKIFLRVSAKLQSSSCGDSGMAKSQTDSVSQRGQ